MWVKFSLPPTLIWLTRRRKAFSQHFCTNFYCTFIYFFKENYLQAIEWLLNSKYVHGRCIKAYISKHTNKCTVCCKSPGHVWRSMNALFPTKTSILVSLPQPACTVTKTQRLALSTSTNTSRAAALPSRQLLLCICLRHVLAERRWTDNSLRRRSRSLAGFFSAAPVVCHLSVGVDWPIQVACCSLPLTFSASADFLALTCLSLLSLDWTGHVQRFLGQRSEGSKKNQGRCTWEQFKRWFVSWQFSSFVWSFGALTSGCWASWAHVPLPMVLESRAQSCGGNTWWSKPLERPDSSWHCSFSLMLYWHPSS